LTSPKIFLLRGNLLGAMQKGLEIESRSRPLFPSPFSDVSQTLHIKNRLFHEGSQAILRGNAEQNFAGDW
jgi:hypothetical protein